jgi:hypothetical protein
MTGSSASKNGAVKAGRSQRNPAAYLVNDALFWLASMKGSVKGMALALLRVLRRWSVSTRSSGWGSDPLCLIIGRYLLCSVIMTRVQL